MSIEQLNCLVKRHCRRCNQLSSTSTTTTYTRAD